MPRCVDAPLKSIVGSVSSVLETTRMISQEDIKQHVLKALPDAVIILKDLTGGGDHYQLEVRSSAFEGLSTLKRHKLVYASLDSFLQTGSLHALALNTKTHSEP